ncbi:response regulator [candidate division KSB1 bacterium]|nr:response regulator [candidate division KSB1 bacterium]RQW00214.1 MAG: response regulator [candidate division KSB1 bacterium]
MNTRRILIVDNDQKNLKVLEANFQASSYMAATASSNGEALHLMTKNRFDIILSEISAASIDGYQLLKEVQRHPQQDSTHVIFLSIKSDVWNRVKSLKLGAKDYIVKPVHVSEIVARVNMVQNRIASNLEKQADSNNAFKGRLEDLAVVDLIEILGIEKKTGILSLNNENGHSGQIIFNRGIVISAATGKLRAEEAFYKMINWNRGRFSMLFTEVHADDEFTLSNMGLLLQGAKRMDLRNELLKQLPSLDAIVITTSNFKKIIAQKEINNELREFMTLFDGERSLGRIIDDSHENEIITLKRIVKLYKLGFLHVLRDFSSEQPVQFKSNYEDDYSDYAPIDDEDAVDERAAAHQDPSGLAHEIDKIAPDNFPGHESLQFDESYEDESIQHQFSDDDVNNGFSHKNTRETRIGAKNRDADEQKTHILLISTDDKNNKDFIRCVMDGKPQEFFFRNARSPVYCGSVTLRDGHQMSLVSFNPNEQYSMLLDYFQEKTLGCIFLLDLETINWSYHRYLFGTLSRHLTVPILIVGKQSQSKSDFESQELRDSLDLNENHGLRFISQIDPDNCRRVLLTLINDLCGGNDQLFPMSSEKMAR